MLETMLEGQALFVIMGTLAAAGVISKCIVNVTLKRLVRAAGNMNKSSHPFMRLVRAKFEHASMISDKVENVKVFVDKYLYEYKVFGVRLHGLRRMETLSAGLCLIVGAAGAGLMYRGNGLNDLVWKTGGTGAGLAVMVCLVHLITDEKYQLDAIRNYMVDYLENVCRHRYEKEKSSQKGIKVLTQEGTAAEFGVMPAAEYNPDREVQMEKKEETDSTERTGRMGQAGQADQADQARQMERADYTIRTERPEQMSQMNQAEYTSRAEQPEQMSQMNQAGHTSRTEQHEDTESADGPYIVRTRKPEGQKSAVSTFHAAERIADEALSAFHAANENVSQSEPMGEILAAKAKEKRGKSIKENTAELPAAEFVRETMESKRQNTPEGAAKRERLEDDIDRDLVIRRILEEFMA